MSVSASLGLSSAQQASLQFKESCGRKFNTVVESYCLPADMEEHERLDSQHKALKLVLGGLTPCPDLVHSVLRPREGYVPRIIDIGTGTGRWAIEMATLYPHAQVLGVDIVPPASPTTKDVPRNYRFELGNANALDPAWNRAFDVVHMRAINPGVENFELLLYETAQIIRPGGVLIVSTGSRFFLNERMQPLAPLNEGEPGFTWTQRIWSTVYNLHEKSSPAQDARENWDPWLRINPNYRDTNTLINYIPIGNFNPGLRPDHQYAGELMKWNLLQLFKTFKPLLLKTGMDSDTIDRSLERVHDEIDQYKIKIYASWTYTWAVRTNGGLVPPPESVKNKSK